MGYVIPGRDWIGGLDPAKNSSAVIAAAVAAVRGRGGGRGRDFNAFRYTGVILGTYVKSNGTYVKSNGT